MSKAEGLPPTGEAAPENVPVSEAAGVPAAEPTVSAARARHDALRAKVKLIAQKSGRPMTEISKEIGIVYGTFSQWVAGTYAGNNGKLDDTAEKWLQSRGCAARKRAELPAGPGFVLTPAATAFFALLEHAQHAPDLAVLTGAAGVGKTTALEAYRARSTNVWIVTGEPCLATPRMMLDEVAEQLGVNEWRSSHRVSRAIVARLRGTRGLVVVDEAQHLTTATLDQLRTLHDMSGVGVALVGNERVSARIEGGSRSPDFAQLFSRVGMRLSRAKPTRADVEALLDGWEVADTEVRRLLHVIARKPGALRGAIKCLRVASMHAAAAAEALGARHVETAWQSLAAQQLDATATTQGGRS